MKDLISHLQNVLELDPAHTVNRFWVDGVPYNSDRSQRLETTSLNIFAEDNLRLPVTAFPKEFADKAATFEEDFEILQWSFEILATGVFQSCRHEGKPFEEGDSYRRKLANKTIGNIHRHALGAMWSWEQERQTIALAGLH